MPYKKLTIPDPCTQKWSKMENKGEGRHCKSCDTTIVDFSDLSDEELIDVLLSGKYHCGRFHEDQMGIMYYAEEKRKERKKYWNSVAAAIVAGVLQISSGFGQTDQQQKQKLYPRSIAFDKYFESDSNVPSDPQPKEKEKEETKDKVTFVFKNKKHNNAMKGVMVSIKELNYHGSSNNEGEIEIALKKDINLTQIVTIEVQPNIYRVGGRKRGYHGKTLFLELGKLINNERIIYIHTIVGHRRLGGKHVLGRLYR